MMRCMCTAVGHSHITTTVHERGRIACVSLWTMLPQRVLRRWNSMPAYQCGCWSRLRSPVAQEGLWPPGKENQTMTSQRTIVFLCPHNAAKSVIAAAYWQRLADQRGWSVRATSAGTDPDPEVAPRVVTALLEEGLDGVGIDPDRLPARTWRPRGASWR